MITNTSALVDFLKLTPMGMGDFAEEKVETLVSKLDVKALLSSKTVWGTVARIIAAIPADARLIGMSYLAAAIEKDVRIDPTLRWGVAYFIRGLPKGVENAIKAADVKPEDLEREFESQAPQVIKAAAKTPQFEVWMGGRESDALHKVDSVHTPPSGDGAPRVQRGDILTMFNAYGKIRPLCPICFGSELSTGSIRIENVEKKTDEKKPDPNVLRQLKKIDDKGKRDFLLTLFLHAYYETLRDPHDGLEGVANVLVSAITLAAIDDPEVLADFIREDPPKLKKSKPEDPDIDIFREADQEISALLLFYQQRHPDSDRMVKARDAADAMWSFKHFGFLPGDWRPKPSSGWAQWAAKNVKIAMGIVGGGLLLLAVVLLVIGGAGLYNIWRITVMLQEYYLPEGKIIEPGFLKILYGVAYLWIFRFIVTATEKIGLAIKDMIVPLKVERDTARLGNVGFFIVTITMAASAIMAVFSLFATANGQIASLFMGFFLATLFTILTTLEFRKLFRQFVTDEQRAKETLQFSGWMLKATLALITVMLVIGTMNYFAPRSNPAQDELAAMEQRSVVGETYTMARSKAIEQVEAAKQEAAPAPVVSDASCAKVERMLQASPDVCELSPGLKSCATARKCGLLK